MGKLNLLDYSYNKNPKGLIPGLCLEMVPCCHCMNKIYFPEFAKVLKNNN